MNRNRCLLIGVCLLAGVTLAGSAAAQGPAGSLEVQLASPGQGEVFYAAPGGVITSVPISGRVVSYDSPVDFETVDVTLTLIDSAGGMTELHTPVGADGYFHVWATINARGPVPILDDHLTDICLTCHVEGQIDIPNNPSQLLVHARTPDGLTGSAVRQITLDRGLPRSLDVRVLGLPEETQGAQVVAGTTIYEWRPRSFYGSLQDGRASVAVEGLSYADLTYQVALLPIIVGDTRYEADPKTVLLPAGASEAPAVVITARPVRGMISGRVVDGASRAGVNATVLALDLLTGASRSAATADDGAFALADLPISRLLLLARSDAGFHMPGEYDLRSEPTQETTIHLTGAGLATLRATITLDGRPLPFAQASVAGLIAAQADPLNGAVEVAAVPAEGDVEVEISAAGCYSRRLTATDRDLGDVALTLHPTTTVLTRGGSRLYLPAATRATRADDVVRLQQGVVWVTGASGAGAAGFAIVVGEYRITGSRAEYAVEALPDALPRLYVSAGEVTATRAAGPPVTVAAGQTLTLTDAAPSPADLAPGTGALLRSTGGSVTRFELEPPLAERVKEVAWGAAGVMAQVLMLGAYAIAFVIMPALLILGAGLWLRRAARGRTSRRG